MTRGCEPETPPSAITGYMTDWNDRETETGFEMRKQMRDKAALSAETLRMTNQRLRLVVGKLLAVEMT